MIKGLIMAISTYSKLPMPRVKWDESAMRYSMCFFPVVGAIVGAIWLGVYYLLDKVGCSVILSAAVLTALPLVITGGIHMDGFLDTVDALSSYKPKEEKLKILKDPHTGAFAIIFCGVYLLLYFGMVSELILHAEKESFYVMALGFMLTRILSGMSVEAFPKAKKEGMLADTASMSSKWNLSVLSVELGIVLGLMGLFGGRQGIFAIVAALLVFIYYRVMSVKKFGGITGDLAGYFLQLCELFILGAVL